MFSMRRQKVKFKNHERAMSSLKGKKEQFDINVKTFGPLFVAPTTSPHHTHKLDQLFVVQVCVSIIRVSWFSVQCQIVYNPRIRYIVCGKKSYLYETTKQCSILNYCDCVIRIIIIIYWRELNELLLFGT